ncbi:MAG TPA: hypothetical protein VM370_11950 [Candidatus Thermoplasmatota archaeon]|nr:hypothetical protein [Candidatus Thermoplasmatota archaeon]
MATATRVLDDTRFEARARIGDVIALGIILVVGGALLFQMYTIGYSASEAARTGDVYARDKTFVFMIIETAIVMLGFAWVVYRLFSGSARRVGG